MSHDLNDFFKLLVEDKKKKKEEFDNLVGDLGLNSIFEEVSALKKKNKEKKIEEGIKLQALETWLHSEKEDIKSKVKQEIVEELVVEEIAEESIVEEINEEPVILEEVITEPKEEVVKEGLLNIPPEVKNSDPLTPLNQKFATLEDLQKHYSLFINRIQQQLSTLGGGGEYRFRFLDGIVGIKTNPGAYDGKFLQWNSTTNKAEFVNPNAVGIASIVSISGVTTYYQATNNDDYIGVNVSNPVTIALPTSPVSGKKITVKDEGNKIATYNITVTVGAGVSVENDTSVIMSINHQSFTYFYNGSNWFLI